MLQAAALKKRGAHVFAVSAPLMIIDGAAKWQGLEQAARR